MCIEIKTNRLISVAFCLMSRGAGRGTELLCRTQVLSWLECAVRGELLGTADTWTRGRTRSLRVACVACFWLLMKGLNTHFPFSFSLLVREMESWAELTHWLVACG